MNCLYEMSHIKSRRTCGSTLETDFLFNSVVEDCFVAREKRQTLVNESSAPGLEGKRRSLGPGGTRGTIELLCRGGGQTATLEIPTVVGYKKPLN